MQSGNDGTNPLALAISPASFALGEITGANAQSRAIAAASEDAREAAATRRKQLEEEAQMRELDDRQASARAAGLAAPPTGTGGKSLGVDTTSGLSRDFLGL